MKQLLKVIAMVALLCLPQAVQAHRDITEADRATLEMVNGKTKEGYIYDYWFNADKLGQQNFSFKFVTSKTGDKDDAYEYNIYDVKRITLANPHDGMPAEWLPVTLAQFDYAKLMNLLTQMKHQLMGVAKRSDHAMLLTCQVLVKSNLNDWETQPATLWALKFNGDALVYPVITDGRVDLDALSHHLKGRRPQLVKYLKRYLKSGKRRKAVVKNPELLLDVYDQYLAENPTE